ncbi:hypothetical protein QEN19_000668 [Hanseniaspora menglaensis]
MTGNNKQTKEQNDNDITIHQTDKYPLWQYMFAGGIGGLVADFIMHPLDTMKTRQQASLDTMKTLDLKLRTLHPIQILKMEGVRKGWYSGLSAAMLGSLPSAAIFFMTYEFLKEEMILNYQINETFTFLIAGLSGDFASSLVYVPSEVLKTRLQLQGKLNKKLFGYNNLRDAVLKMKKFEGTRVFYSGYGATLLRDLPFSAIQFALYEKFRQISCQITTKRDDQLGVTEELLVGGLAGAIAGAITTPLDVVKTRLQTNMSQIIITNDTTAKSTDCPQPATQNLFTTFRNFYKREGILKMFGGIGPRIMWSSVQSSIMLYIYQTILKHMHESKNEKRKSDEIDFTKKI